MLAGGVDCQLVATTAAAMANARFLVVACTPLRALDQDHDAEDPLAAVAIVHADEAVAAQQQQQSRPKRITNLVKANAHLMKQHTAYEAIVQVQVTSVKGRYPPLRANRLTLPTHPTQIKRREVHAAQLQSKQLRTFVAQYRTEAFRLSEALEAATAAATRAQKALDYANAGQADIVEARAELERLQIQSQVLQQELRASMADGFHKERQLASLVRVAVARTSLLQH